MMLPIGLDMTLALKAINLSSTLSGTDKRVACAVLDHFNRKTGQCDPSLETIAVLLNINRRTVIRAVNRFVKLGLFRRLRHGGHFHRNSYEPNWLNFREMEAQWVALRRAHRLRFSRPKMSPIPCQSSHDGGDKAVSQTCISNQSQLTSEDGSSVRAKSSAVQVAHDPKGLPRDENETAFKETAHASHVKQTRSRDAARDAAQRRWDTDLLKRYVSEVQVYARIVDAIDLALSGAATEAELAKRGEGTTYIIQELTARGVLPSDSAKRRRQLLRRSAMTCQPTQRVPRGDQKFSAHCSHTGAPPTRGFFFCGARFSRSLRSLPTSFCSIYQCRSNSGHLQLSEYFSGGTGPGVSKSLALSD